MNVLNADRLLVEIFVRIVSRYRLGVWIAKGVNMTKEVTLNEYQKTTQERAIYPGQGEINGMNGGLNYCILALCGEAGELANTYKKLLRDEHGQVNDKARENLLLELGDCMWYMARIAQELNCNLADVAQMNITKLHNRALKKKIELNELYGRMSL